MAILLKDKIDQKVLERKNQECKKRQSMIKRAEELRESILYFAERCTDILDTTDYLSRKKIASLESDFSTMHRSDISSLTSMVMFECIRRRDSSMLSINYRISSDYQSCAFADGHFYISCVSQEDKRSIYEPLKSIRFANKTDYYISQAILVMQGFDDCFGGFDVEFSRILNSLLS